MQPVASVEVSPSAETIGLGGTLQLTAEGFDANGHAVADAEFSWESSDPAIATVDASGLVTGVCRREWRRSRRVRSQAQAELQQSRLST